MLVASIQQAYGTWRVKSFRALLILFFSVWLSLFSLARCVPEIKILYKYPYRMYGSEEMVQNSVLMDFP
jgi:hypothetical protein